MLRVFFCYYACVENKQVISILKNNGIGILPTDTLYGVVGSAFSKKAVERIHQIKERDENKPFIVLLSQISDLAKFGITLNSTQKNYLDSVWPGPVSVILPCYANKFAYLHRDTKSIAFRIPKNKKLREFLLQTGPLVAPSANPQGEMPATTIREAKKYFSDNVDFYIAGGKKKGNENVFIPAPPKGGKPSKIVSLASDSPVIIRE